MYLNDLNSAAHNVEKINKVLANTFGHNINISEMSTNALERMLTATNAKIVQIKESDLAYWDNPQYNKLHLISHSLRTFINEVAPGRTDGKKMKTKVKESTDLEQAEVMLAAQELVDELQKMVEDLAEMQVQKLMPIVDAMKEQVGFEIAEAYNTGADAALANLLDQAKAAKEALENATLAARGEAPATPMPTDMSMEPEVTDMPDEGDMDLGDEFDGDPAAAGEDNATGREMKESLDMMEAQALKEKKFLEAKDRVFQMLEAGQITKEQFLNLINELDSGAKKNWWSRTPDQRDQDREFKAKYKNDPLANWNNPKAAQDGGIPQGTTTGGPSKLRQRKQGQGALYFHSADNYPKAASAAIDNKMNGQMPLRTMAKFASRQTLGQR
jgi:hypothetical protein